MKPDTPQAYWEALDLSYLADTMTSAAYPCRAGKQKTHYAP